MQRTLLLNASYEPLRIISWQRAVTLLFLGKVEIVHEYDSPVRAVSLAINMPCVVRLLKYVKIGRRKPPLTKLNLLARDNYQCQYCSTRLDPRDWSVDHVVPRSQGGGTHWRNVVACCHQCNRKKGGRTPQQARMKLLKEVVEPAWLPIISVSFHKNLPTAWLMFLE